MHREDAHLAAVGKHHASKMGERRRAIDLGMRDDVLAALRSPDRRATGAKDFFVGGTLVAGEPNILERECTNGRNFLQTRDRMRSNTCGAAMHAIPGDAGNLI